jgi:hypothetical protein
MLSQAQRTTILELHRQGVGKREIARVLGISRVAVRKVLRSNSTAVPALPRPEKAEPYRQQILELFEKCKGNLVRVHEDLLADGAKLSYAALTAFCRRHGIGYEPPAPAGHYDWPPGVELQHDTSPHELELAGKKRKVQTASAVRTASRGSCSCNCCTGCATAWLTSSQAFCHRPIGDQRRQLPPKVSRDLLRQRRARGLAAAAADYMGN